jgi:phage terminase small subunit
MNKIAEQFGLTPAARSRITAGADMKGAVIDDMDELLGGG